MEKKKVIVEVNRMRQIMGLNPLNEQTTSMSGSITPPEDFESDELNALRDEVSEDENAFKTVYGGKPYELFLEKATTESKLYLESTGEETTTSVKFNIEDNILGFLE